MTSTEMRDLFYIKFDSLYENAAPSYDDTQIDQILSNAQHRIVKRILESKTLGYDEMRKKYLAPLYSAASITGNGNIVVSDNQDEAFENGTIYDLPSDLWYITLESVLLTGSSSRSSVKPKSLDFYTANINNPYQNPNANNVWRFERGNAQSGARIGQKRVELVTDGTTITDYAIRYLTSVPDIVIGSVDSIIHEDLHDDIVDEAYKIATGAVKQDEYNVATNESLNS